MSSSKVYAHWIQDGRMKLLWECRVIRFHQVAFTRQRQHVIAGLFINKTLVRSLQNHWPPPSRRWRHSWVTLMVPTAIVVLFSTKTLIQSSHKTWSPPPWRWRHLWLTLTSPTVSLTYYLPTHVSRWEVFLHYYYYRNVWRCDVANMEIG